MERGPKRDVTHIHDPGDTQYDDDGMRVPEKTRWWRMQSLPALVIIPMIAGSFLLGSLFNQQSFRSYDEQNTVTARSELPPGEYLFSWMAVLHKRSFVAVEFNGVGIQRCLSVRTVAGFVVGRCIITVEDGVQVTFHVDGGAGDLWAVPLCYFDDDRLCVQTPHLYNLRENGWASESCDNGACDLGKGDENEPDE